MMCPTDGKETAPRSRPGDYVGARAVLIGINVLVLGWYLIDIDVPARPLQVFLGMLIALCLAAAFLLRSRSCFAILLQKAVLSIFVSIFLFWFLDVAWRIAPGVFPGRLRYYLASENVREQRAGMVECLDHNPWVKFKANTEIRTQGYHGTDEQFCYQWKTDRLGFKNAPPVSNLTNAVVVALGDSYMEGYGVPVEGTLPALLTTEGFPTYNLGVQGYAPTQLVGALKEYGLRFHPRVVLVSYTAKSYPREKAFFNSEQAMSEKRFTGGIQQVVSAEERFSKCSGEIRVQARHVFSAIYMMLFDFANKYYHVLGNRLALDSVGKRERMMRVLRENPREWNSMISAFDRIVKMARSSGAAVVLVYFPHREEIYFEREKGEKLPEWYYGKLESELLEKYAAEKGVPYVDPSRTLIECVNNLPSDAAPGEYPYLPVDSHMSEKGYRIISTRLLPVLKSALEE